MDIIKMMIGNNIDEIIKWTFSLNSSTTQHKLRRKNEG